MKKNAELFRNCRKTTDTLSIENFPSLNREISMIHHASQSGDQTDFSPDGVLQYNLTTPISSFNIEEMLGVHQFCFTVATTRLHHTRGGNVPNILHHQ